MILTARKLTRKRSQYFGKSGCDKSTFIIPEAKTVMWMADEPNSRQQMMCKGFICDKQEK